MARMSELADRGAPDPPLSCSFCMRPQTQVKKIIAGPGVYICDECVQLCYDIITEELGTP